MSFPDQAYTDQAESITENAIGKSIPIYNLLVEYFSGWIQASESFGEVQLVLDREAASPDFIKGFGIQMHDALTTEDALGRSFLVEKDRFYSDRVKKRTAKFAFDGVRADYLDFGLFTLKDDRVKISFDLTPQAAAEYMRTKGFWIAGIENDELLKAIQKSLSDALAAGETWQEWKARADQIFEQFKAQPMEPHRLQTVFRTNLYSAYSSAQLDQIASMPDRFPLWRYVAILDSVTRPSHAALNGMVFNEGEGPYPPIDYNCRCSAQHLHLYQVDSENLKPSSDVRLPATVIDFTDPTGFEKYLAERQTSMNPSISRSVRENL